MEEKKKASINIIIPFILDQTTVSILPQLPGASTVIKAQSGIWAVWTHFCHSLPAPYNPKHATILCGALRYVPEKKKDAVAVPCHSSSFG